MYFPKRITMRLRAAELELIKEIVANSSDKYESPSHFVRCSVIKNIRSEHDKLTIKS